MLFDGEHKLELTSCRMHVRPVTQSDEYYAAVARLWRVHAVGPTSIHKVGDVVHCSLEVVLTIDDRDHAITNDCLVIAKHPPGCGCTEGTCRSKS